MNVRPNTSVLGFVALILAPLVSCALCSLAPTVTLCCAFKVSKNYSLIG